MKKIAYIELDTHAEIVQDFINIMSGSTQFSVNYFLSEKIKKQIVTKDEVVYSSDSSRILDQLAMHSYDLVIIGTVHRYFNTFLAITMQYKSAVIVHNLNFSKISKGKLIQNIIKKDIVYRLKLWWKEGLINAPKVYENAHQLLVLDEEINSTKYKFLPLFFTKKFQKNNSEVVKIVIPGGVSQARRDYKHIISTLQKFEANCKKSNGGKLLEFIFLGKAQGEELKEIIHLERSLEYINITYFKERISASIFDKYMQNADVLWCPIQRETEFFSQKEIYGKTKMTGNLGDAIKFGKMAVFPSQYSTKQPFIIKEKENLLELFLSLKNKEFNFQNDFGKQKIQKDIEGVISKMISI